MGQIATFPPTNDPGNVPFGTLPTGYEHWLGRLWGGQTSKTGLEDLFNRVADTSVFQDLQGDNSHSQ